MAEAAQGTQQEFWRPPSPTLGPEVMPAESVPAMAEVCPRCNTEFLLAARFCHTCGVRRPVAVKAQERTDATVVAQVWEGFTKQVSDIWSRVPLDKLKFPDFGKLRTPAWLHYLHFHEIRTRIGLSTASLIAFVLGLVCVAGALLVGLLTAKTLVDWQAIQMYRIEWLLAATAAFVAGILLKKNSRDEQD
ncbi:MAG TPA: hypothetical protein VMP68_22375 [Candidatus Eisenbacteria bacterium]|nr:hypothetical protein [Candidatus Eisenbacteria bacterium]